MTAVKGVTHGEKRLGGGVPGVEGETAFGDFILAGAFGVEPGETVGDSPGEDGADGWIAEGLVEVGCVSVGYGCLYDLNEGFVAVLLAVGVTHGDLSSG